MSMWAEIFVCFVHCCFPFLEEFSKCLWLEYWLNIIISTLQRKLNLEMKKAIPDLVWGTPSFLCFHWKLVTTFWGGYYNYSSKVDTETQEDEVTSSSQKTVHLIKSWVTIQTLGHVASKLLLSPWPQSTLQWENDHPWIRISMGTVLLYT